MVLTRNQRLRMMTKMDRNRTEVTGVDRLSELPDAILHHIFSFMDTKYIVTACVLSKRYEFLWHSLTIFRFNQKKYRNYDFFLNFIIQVLLHCEGLKIKSFSLEFVCTPNRYFLRKLLSYLLPQEPQHLRLNIGIGGNFTMNPILSSESLKTLQASWGSINGSYSLNFPILTTLFLDKPTFNDRHFVFSKFFSGCPNLKHLTLHNCICELDVFSVVGNQLEKLDISIQYYQVALRIVIECSKLCSFKYKGESFVKITANVPSIEKVDLDCVVHRFGQGKIRMLNIIEMVQQFQHSKYLKFGLGIMKVLASNNVYEQRFPLSLCNLTFLELRLPSEYKRMSDVIVYLLRHSQAEVFNGKKLWEEILNSEGMQERTYFIDRPQKVKVMITDKYHIQLKVNYQLTQGWNSMFTRTSSNYMRNDLKFSSFFF